MTLAKIGVIVGLLMLAASLGADLLGFAECTVTDHNHTKAGYFVGTILSILGGLAHCVIWEEEKERQHKENMAVLSVEVKDA